MNNLLQIKAKRDIARLVVVFCIFFNLVSCIAAFFSHTKDERMLVAGLLTISTLIGIKFIFKYRKFNRLLS